MIPQTGGRYLRREDGTLERVEEPTRHHPEGDAPRMADGTLIGADGLPIVPDVTDADSAGPAAPEPAIGEEEH